MILCIELLRKILFFVSKEFAPIIPKERQDTSNYHTRLDSTRRSCMTAQHLTSPPLRCQNGSGVSSEAPFHRIHPTSLRQLDSSTTRQLDPPSGTAPQGTTPALRGSNVGAPPGPPRPASQSENKKWKTIQRCPKLRSHTPKSIPSQELCAYCLLGQGCWVHKFGGPFSSRTYYTQCRSGLRAACASSLVP